MNLQSHIKLLLKFHRAKCLEKIIKKVVESGCSVLDAGCGTGLLSLWSVLNGASRVVAVDSANIEIARNIAAENGLAKSITFIEEDLSRITLPGLGGKRFDVLLAMIYFTDPRRDEAQSKLMFDLKKRFLAPGGVMVPDRVRYSAAAYDWPEQDLPTKQAAFREKIKLIEKSYDLRFGALSEALNELPQADFFPERSDSGEFEKEGAVRLSREVVLPEVDYRRDSFAYPGEILFSIKSPGIFNTVVWKQEIFFEDVLIFSNESVSWVGNPRQVNSGEKITADMDDQWRWRNVFGIS